MSNHKPILDPSYKALLWRNQDESFIRSVIITTMFHLRRIKYPYVDHQNKKIIYQSLPVVYSYATDRQFYIDFFTNLPPNCPNDWIETDYNVYPRLMLKLSQISMHSQGWSGGIEKTQIEQTEYDENGNIVLVRYATNYILLPTIFTFKSTILAKSLIQNFIITESIITHLIDANKFDFYYKGISISNNIIMNDTSMNIDNKQKISFGDENNTYKSEFTITVQTHMPIFIGKKQKIAESIIQEFNDTYYPK